MHRTKDTPRTAYLRHRPFLLIEMLLGPAPGTRTHRKHWQREQRTDVHERPMIVHHIGYNRLRQAAVIIDLEQQHVLKNVFRNPPDDREPISDADILKHFSLKYATMINQAV